MDLRLLFIQVHHNNVADSWHLHLQLPSCFLLYSAAQSERALLEQ